MTYVARLPRVIGMLLVLTACHPNGPTQEPRKAPEPTVLAIITDLEGTDEPCGCTSEPLGGLAKLATRLSEVRAQGLLLLGNTFTAAAVKDPALKRRDVQKSTVLTQMLRRLAPLAWVLGPADNSLDDGGLRARLATDSHIPLWSDKVDYAVMKRGAVTLGLINASTAVATVDPQAISRAAVTLRAQGARFVMLLVPTDAAAAIGVLQKVQGIDAAVLAGGHDETAGPTVVNGVLVLQAGRQGQHLGILRLVPRGSRAWTYDDAGQSAKDLQDSRLKRLQQEIARLPEGPARAARQAKLTALQAVPPPPPALPPDASTVTWTLEPLSRSVADAPWARTMLDDYNQSLCRAAQQDTHAAPCPTPDNPGHAYVGSATCQACHAAAWTTYSNTAHAHAWATLTKVAKNCDVGCIGCHSVGYDAPGGFCRQADATQFANVGCENCHGPGAAHVAHPSDRKQWALLHRAVGETTCRGCHTPEHSDKFDFATYLPRILGEGHRAKAAAAVP